jgi:hypothetical protein
MQYNRFKFKYLIYLRGRVKFPIGGIEMYFSKPASLIFLGRIWCDSKADSIVWMGEGGGSAFVQHSNIERLFSVPVNSPSSPKLEGFYVLQGLVLIMPNLSSEV